MTPIFEYLLEFELKDPVLTSQLTFADMSAHRTTVPFIKLAWIRNATPPKVLISQLKHLDMPSKLSFTVNYSNVAYAIAGEATADVTGMSYADLITTKIFEPLGLKSAGLSHANMAKLPKFAMAFTAASFEEAKKGIYDPAASAPAVRASTIPPSHRGRSARI
ncbi:hypothetical protein BGZ79_006130 [Entomortierella chlamydospora]|nr:hypothetical protein BGZ79_006130 [Entomortierella chlamydospora]